MEEDNKNRRFKYIDIERMLTLAGAGCIIVLFYLLIGRLGVILSVIGGLLKAMTPIIIGCIIAFLLNPLVNKLRVGLRKLLKNMFKEKNLEKQGKVADVLAVVFAIMFFIILLGLFLWILIPSIYDSINRLYENFDKYTGNIEGYVRAIIRNNPTLVEIINNYMDDIEEAIKNLLTQKLLPNMDSVVKAVSTGIWGGVKFVLNFVIGIIAAIYLLLSKDKFSAQFKKVVYAFFDKKNGNKILSAIEYVDAVFGGFISGKIIDSIIIGMICFAFCRIVNMPYAVLISVIIGITNIIPFFGPFIGAIPSAVLVLVESPKMCLVFIIFIIILQQVDGNIIGPLILSDSTGLSSFWVLFAILVGGNLFGFGGMILGVPTLACLYALMTRILRNKLNKRGLSNNTEYFVALRGFDENGNPVRGPKQKIISSRDKKKIEKFEKQKAQLQASKNLINKVTHHDKSHDVKKEEK
ncbi:MAG: AI-2E family transporter [Eubacterium sp.]|nr:AI-2E family transporter [Eubacterium sp.]